VVRCAEVVQRCGEGIGRPAPKEVEECRDSVDADRPASEAHSRSTQAVIRKAVRPVVGSDPPTERCGRASEAATTVTYRSGHLRRWPLYSERARQRLQARCPPAPVRNLQRAGLSLEAAACELDRARSEVRLGERADPPKERAGGRANAPSHGRSPTGRGAARGRRSRSRGPNRPLGPLPGMNHHGMMEPEHFRLRRRGCGAGSALAGQGPVRRHPCVGGNDLGRLFPPFGCADASV